MRFIKQYIASQAWLIVKRLPDVLDREIEHQRSKLVILGGGVLLLFTRLLIGI